MTQTLYLDYYLDLLDELEESKQRFTRAWNTAILLTVRKLTGRSVGCVQDIMAAKDRTRDVVRLRCLTGPRNEVCSFTYPFDTFNEVLTEVCREEGITLFDGTPIISFLPYKEDE